MLIAGKTFFSTSRKCSHDMDSLRLNHSLNSLIQYANFFKIRQIYNIKKAIGGLLAFFLADFEEISILYEGIKKMDEV